MVVLYRPVQHFLGALLRCVSRRQVSRAQPAIVRAKFFLDRGDQSPQTAIAVNGIVGCWEYATDNCNASAFEYLGASCFARPYWHSACCFASHVWARHSKFFVPRRSKAVATIFFLNSPLPAIAILATWPSVRLRVRIIAYGRAQLISKD